MVKRFFNISDKIILDTPIYLGITHANNSKYRELHDILLSPDSSWKVVICPKIWDEVVRNLKKVHLALNIFYFHIIHMYEKLNKLEHSTETNLPSNCVISDNDDEHLIKCALSCGSNTIITKDRKLVVSQACNVEIIQIEDFLAKIRI